MPRSFIHQLIISTAIGVAYISFLSASHAKSTGQVQSQDTTIESHFAPRPSSATRIDYDAWDFLLGEVVLYMGPSARQRPPGASKVGPRATSHTSRFRLEGNKVMYSLLPDEMKTDIKAYADELIELGNRLDIPSLSNNEQLAYWFNLHHAVLLTTISENYLPPHRRPSLIKPIKGSDARLHDAKLITIDDYALSLRDIREKIVFPNWRYQDVPYGFHLGNLGSPNMANYAYSASDLDVQLKNNAEEFINSHRAFHRGKLNSYFRDISPWYYPDFYQDLDSYFEKRMRPEVYTEYKLGGVRKIVRADLTLADLTGGIGKKSSILPYIRERAFKFDKLWELEWYRNGFVTIEDIPTTDDGPITDAGPTTIDEASVDE